MSGIHRLTVLLACFAVLCGVAPAQESAESAAASSANAFDYYVYVAAESADEVYKVVFDGERAQVADVIDVGYQATEIEGPRGLTWTGKT